MITDILKLAHKELCRKKIRSLAVILGYILTIVLMVATSSILLFSRSVENQVLSSTGTHFVVYMPNCGDITSLTEEEIAKLAQGIIPEKCKELCKNCTGCNKKPIDLLNEGFIVNTNTTRLLSIELVKKISKLETVKEAYGYLLFRVRDAKTNRLFSIGGLDPDNIAVQSNCFSKADLIDGKLFSENASNSVVLEIGFASNLNLKPGAKMILANEEFTVSGIVNSGAKPGKAEVYMRFADAERIINRRITNPLFQEINVILIESKNAKLHAQAIKDVKKIVLSEAIISYGCYKPASKAMGINENSIWVFIILTFAGSIFFAMKVQLSSIIERQKDIAILKAIGWKNQVIILQILFESLIQAVAGTLGGVLIGAVILEYLPIAEWLGIETQIGKICNLEMAVILVVFTLCAGLISALIPAGYALSQRPAVVLRRT